MKKFWEKHDLVKIAGLMVLLTAVLTWLVPQGYYQSNALSVGEITRIGIFDFFTYGLLGMYYFTVLVTFLFVLGGFYQVLARAGGYQALTDKIAKKFIRKEILFSIIVSFIIAALAAITNEYIVLVAVIPFIINIMSKMKSDKLTVFLTTFGAILIGVLGSIYSAKIVGQSVSALSTTYGSFLWVKLLLFFVSYMIYVALMIVHIKKSPKSKKSEVIEDTFVSEEVTKNKKTWPVIVVLALFAVITLLAYLPWTNVFKVTIFTDAYNYITSLQVFDSKIFSYILGNVQEFGSWDIFGVQVLMLIAALVIKWIYKISTNDFLTSFGEGFKKVGKLVVLLLLSYLILEFAVMFPVIPTIVDWFMNLTDKFNVLLGTVSGLFTSLFTVEYQYTVNLIGSYMIGTYTQFTKEIAIMLQSTYGLACLFAPSSAILLIGLSYCNISYKEWFKYIWKFVVVMFVLILIIMLAIF